MSKMEQLTVRVSPRVYDYIDARAQKDGVSLVEAVRAIIEEQINKNFEMSLQGIVFHMRELGIAKLELEPPLELE